MRILSLHAENVKKLKVVDITADPDVVVLTGRNEQGKTSALDAIEYVLAGGKALKYTPEPIRRGEERAVAHVFLGEPDYDDAGNETACEPNLKVTRTWKGNNTYLKVENADGSVRKSGQGLLDSIVGNLTFDPLAFSSLKDKEQLETLLALVQLPINLDDWKVQRQAVYDDRTATNRTLKEIEAQISGISFPPDTPDKETSAAQVLEEQRQAQSVIDANRAKRADLDALCQRIATDNSDKDTIKKDIERIETELIDLRQDLAGIESRIEDEEAERVSLSTECDQLVDPDLSIFRDRIAQVEAVNRHVRSKQELATLKARLDIQNRKSAASTKKISELDKQREDTLASAKMPVEGLAFDDNGVTYRGIPFRQCSSEERLRISVAMGMALNPKLRVMFIRDASLLDDKNREAMRQMAKDNQYQVWMEVVGNRASTGLVFEDGEVVADNRAEK